MRDDELELPDVRSVPTGDERDKSGACTEVTALSRHAQRLLGLGQRDATSLIVVAGDSVGEMHQLAEPETIIGRGDKVHIRVRDDSISRQHARIHRMDGAFVVEDMGSANGTFVNGQKISRHRLEDGDKISVGTRTILKFAYQDKLDESFQRGMYERALQDGLYRALFASSPMPSFLVDGETLLIFATNAAALATYGFSEAEFQMRTFPSLEVEAPTGQMLSSGRRPCRHRTKDRGILDIELVTQELRFQDRQAWLAIANDVTERKKLEERLRVGDRMASVGTLAAGVAHEINNPLTYVISNLSFIAEGLRATGGDTTARLDELRSMTSEAHEGAERIRTIVRALKSFSKTADDDGGMGLVDIHHVLNTTVNMAWNEVRHRARLIKDYAMTPIVAHGHGARLGQVFLNLLINAAQAIPEGASPTNEIRITTRQTAARQAVIEFHDTGSGIAPEIRGRLFDPFFTTKVASGTGLGLSICHTIVTAHGGRIEVDSEVGKGSVFRVVLPLADTGVSEDRLPGERPSWAPPRLQRGLVLIIDDDIKVATAFRRALEPEHDVRVVGSGADALERIREGTRFDVILCDLMMPAMTGMDLHALLRDVAREQAERMIFVTGGAFTATARTFLDQVPNERVEKPIAPAELRALVGQVISDRRRGTPVRRSTD